MAQWKEIYSHVKRYDRGPETSYMCKVPSNSLFYDRTHVVSQVADMMLTFPRKRDGFSYYTTDYKNTAVSENLGYTFDGAFNEVIALKDAGKIDIKFEVLKKEKMVNMSLVTRTYCTKLNEYLMEHLGNKTNKTVYVLNATGSGRVFLNLSSVPAAVRAFDTFGNPAPAPALVAGLNSAAVPEGGYLVLGGIGR